MSRNANVIELAPVIKRAKRAAGRRGLSAGQKRAQRGWLTRLSNLLAKGLIDEEGVPSRKEKKRRIAQALRAGETRRANRAA